MLLSIALRIRYCKPFHRFYHSQIVKTYSNSLGRLTEQIGFSKRSLAEWGSQVQHSFSSGTTAAQKFGHAFRTALSAPAQPKEYKTISSGQIVTGKNIDSYIPELTKEQARSKLALFQNYDKKVRNGTKSWTTQFSRFNDNEQWQTEFIQNTDLQRASVEDLMKANQAARTAAIAHNEAIKAQTISAKLGQTAMKGLSMSLNVLAFTFISIGVEKFISWIDDTIHQSERLQEAAAEAKSAINDIRSSFQQLSSSTNEIKERYAELAQGIDQATGKNISLDTEDYQEFLELNNKLSELFPSLTKNYDENGNAILNLSGNIDTIVGSLDRLIEDQESLANQKILEKLPDAYAGYADNLKTYTEQLEKETTKLKAYQEFENNGYEFESATDDIYGTSFYKLNLGKDISSESAREIMHKFQEELNSTGLYAMADYDMDSDGIDEDGNRFIRFTAYTDDALEEMKNFSTIGREIMGGLKADTLQNLSDTRLLLQQETTEFSSSIYAMVDRIPQFTQNVSKEQQELISQMLTQDTSWVLSMNQELGDKVEPEELTDWLYQNILNPIKKENIQLSLFELLSPESELSPEQIVELAESLKEQFEEHKIPLNLDFILNPETEGSPANITKRLDQIITDVLNQKYDIGTISPFQTSNPDTTASYFKDYNAIKKFIEENEIHTQDEIAAFHEAFEESENNIDEAFDKYLDKIRKTRKSSFQFDPASFANTTENIASIDSLYQQVSTAAENGMNFTFQISDIEQLRDVFGETCDSFREFELLATSSSASAEDLKSSLNQLLTEAIITENSFDGLNSSTRDSIVSQLELQNVSNASTVITDRVAQVLGNASDHQLSLADAADFASNGLFTENDYADGTTKTIYALAAAEIAYNNSKLDTKQKIHALEELSQAYGDQATASLIAMAMPAAVKAANTRIRYESGDYDQFLMEALEEQLQKIMASLKKYTGNIFDFGSSTPSNNNKDNSKTGSSGSGSDFSGEEAKKQETPQTYDWIENKLSSITKLTEQMGKAFEKAFSLSSSKAKFQEYLTQIEAEITANKTAISTYETKLGEIGLEDAWVQKIKNGDYLIEDVTDEDLKKKISEYESYYNKQKQCEEELQALAEKKEQAQKSYADKMISHYDKQTSKIERLITLRKALVSIKETFGGSASAKDVRYQQNKTLKEISGLERQNQNLKKLQKSTKKGTEAWQAYQEQIKKNKEKTEELIQSIAELASELAKLPLEKLERYLEKNNAKNELYEAMINNSTSAKKKNTLVNKQINVTEQNNRKTQQTAKQTAKQLNTSITAIKSAKTKDFKGLSKTGKKNLNKDYKKLQTYVKKKKQIPAELIKKFANAGLENLVKAISNYNAAIAANETAQETAKLTKETSKKEIAQLNLQKFQNIQDSYSLKQDALSRRASKFSSALDLSEARGHLADKTYYIRLKKLEKKNIENLEAERKRLQSRLNSMLASGDIKKNSEEWQAMVEAIQSVDEALAQSEINFQEYQNQINQVKFDRFDYKLEQISRLISESDFYVDLMSNKPLTNDTGLNKRGITTMGLHLLNFRVYKKQAAMYQEQIKKINEDLAKDPANTTLIEQLQKYQDMQRECLKNSQAEKQAIADLVKEGYEALIDSLGESINKYKEFLQNAKNAHDYQRNISKQTENISTLRKQISAYSSMTDNPETAAKLQRLKEELENAEDNLNETMYDKYLSDTQNAMDDMLKNLEDFISKLSKDRQKLFETGVGMITDSTDAISATLEKLSTDFGVTLSNAMANSWDSEKLITDGIKTIIDTFNNLWKEAKKKNDEQAYETASRSYSNSYQKLEKAKKDSDNAEEKRAKAKKNLGKAIENLDTQEQEHGKNSKQYKKAFKKLQTAQKKFESADKEYQQSKKKVSDLKAEKKATKDSDKTVIKDYLLSIADKEPSKKIEDMDILDKAVFEITQGYLNEQNRENLLKLLHTNNKKTAADILWDLELYKGVPTLEKSHPTTTEEKYETTKNHAVDKNGRPIWNYAVEENVKPSKNASEILYIPKYGTASYSKVTADSEQFGTGISDLPVDYFPQAESLFKGFTSTYSAVPTSEPEYVSVSIGDLYLPNVTNPEDFSDGLVDALKNNPTVQKTFSTFVNASLTGGNSLGIRKF